MTKHLLKLIITLTFIFAVEEMDRKDRELRKIIRLLWPLQAKKQMTLLIPTREGHSRKRLFLLKEFKQYFESTMNNSIHIKTYFIATKFIVGLTSIYTPWFNKK